LGASSIPVEKLPAVFAWIIAVILGRNCCGGEWRRTSSEARSVPIKISSTCIITEILSF